MKYQGWRTGTIGGVGILAAWFVACAGEDIPPVDNALRGAIADSYGGEFGQTGGGAAGAGGNESGGAAGASGTGGSAATPAGGAAGAGGSGSTVGGSSGSGGGVVCDAYGTIFVQKCSGQGSNCHGDGSLNGVFAGPNPPVAGDLVDQESSRGEACGVLVDSANTENSLILQMVEGIQGPACFLVPMPLGEDDLPANEIDCITDWLTQFGD